MLTVERLRQIMDYDRETGVFTWRARLVTHKCHKAWNAQWAGKAVRVIESVSPGTRSKHFTIRISGKHYGAHRLAWLHVTGAWPKHEIDHRDTDGQNNRFNNLREATHAQNQCNKGVMRNNSCGVKGVSYRPNRLGKKKYYAQINWQHKVRFLGWFATAEEGGEVYRAKAAELHGEFLHSSLREPWSAPTIKECIIDPWVSDAEARREARCSLGRR